MKPSQCHFTVAVVLCAAATGFAAPAHSAAAMPGALEHKTFWDLFRAGGFMMWIMLAASMFTLSLMIECAMRLRQNVAAPSDLYRQLRGLVRRGDYHEAWRVARARPCPLSRIVAAALERLGQGRDAVNAAVEEYALGEFLLMRTRVNYLSVIGVVAPMLGLIGTVVGMIKAFHVVGYMGTHPDRLAEAIGEVLVATAFGLFIAVPSFFAFYFFRNRAQRVILGLQEKLTRLLDKLPYAELQGIVVGHEPDEEDDFEPAPAAAISCPSCRSPLAPGASSCPACGAQLQWS